VRWMVITVALAIGVGCDGPTQEDLDKVSDQLQTCQEEKAAVAEDLAAEKAAADAAMEDFRKLLTDLEPLQRGGVAKLEIVDGRATINIGADVLFNSGSASLSGAGMDHIRAVTRVLANRTNQDFQVQGHTDDDPIDSREFPSNWHLASERSLNVVQFMIADGGMPADRISAASYGQERPIVPNTTPTNKLLNRRIEIVLMPDLSDLPGYDELMKEFGRKRAGAPAAPGGRGKAGGGRAGKGGGGGGRR
jgi:chemotaxis protein MotB